jgi:aspartate 1-decarboxylase
VGGKYIMQRFMMKSKIHRAIVTDANLNYQGSITIDKNLMELADIMPNEKVQVLNINNGARFDTYAIEGERGSGTICINGAAARLCQVGDIIIIISYAIMDDEEAKNHKPKVIFVDENNKPVNM